jgi:hypothetical protein
MVALETRRTDGYLSTVENPAWITETSALAPGEISYQIVLSKSNDGIYAR